MKLNPHLDEAVAIFKSLGWHEATREEAPHLPLGTVAQQRLAVKGLQSGDWGEFAQTSANTYGWVSAVNVDQGMLALFAIRSGVDVRRAEQLALGDDQVLLQCVSQRGEDFVRKYLEQYYRSTRRMHEHSLSVQGAVGVGLVCLLGGEPLPNVDYLKDWAVIALEGLTGERREIYRNQTWLPDFASLTPTFAQHVQAAVENGLPMTGPFGKVLPVAVEKGLVSREDALHACIVGLDTAVRPGDRKTFSSVIASDLQINQSELLEFKEIITTALSTGEAPVVEAFASRLIAAVETAEVAEVALPALYAKTSKSRLSVLKALNARENLDAADALMLAGRLSEIAESSDKSAARLAKKLLESWNLYVASPEDDETVQLRGLWQPTPPLWEVPRFELGEVSATSLAQAVNLLRSDEQYIFDLEGDHLLALAVALANKDSDEVRLAFSGVSVGLWRTLVSYWAKGNEIVVDASGYPSHAEMVFAYLGKIPCLLSTPSFEDSSVTYSDLVARLEQYSLAGQSVLQTDLVLALLRLDVTQVDDTKLPSGVPVVLVDGTFLERDAAQVIGDYIADPLPEGTVNTSNPWLNIDFEIPQSLDGLALPFNLSYTHDLSARLFPHWGTAAFTGIHWYGQELTYAGLCAADAAYRAKPLPSAAAINLLAMQRPVHPKMAPYCAEAVQNAWERGLLIPGVADVAFLDWQDEPSNLASLASALQELTELGMLSVVWPVLDDLLVASLASPRLVAGTAKVAEVMSTLVSEVLAAVESGLADSTALAVPGVRALATRRGTSKAVEAARTVVALLPEVEVEEPKQPEKPEGLPAGEFEKIWTSDAGLSTHIEDGSRICGFNAETAISTCALPVMFELEDFPGDVFTHVSRNWYYSITQESQAHMKREGAGGVETEGYLRWDGKRLVFSDFRNWSGKTDAPLEAEATPRSAMLAKILLADLATAPDPIAQRNIVRDMVLQGFLGVETTQKAVSELLPFEQWSPARAVYLLESAPELLPALWPLLTEPLRYAAQQSNMPRWVNRVLDIVKLHAGVLKEATLKGCLPNDAWEGIQGIAAKKGSNTAMKKARDLEKTFLSQSAHKEP